MRLKGFSRPRHWWLIKWWSDCCAPFGFCEFCLSFLRGTWSALGGPCGLRKAPSALLGSLFFFLSRAIVTSFQQLAMVTAVEATLIGRWWHIHVINILSGGDLFKGHSVLIYISHPFLCWPNKSQLLISKRMSCIWMYCISKRFMKYYIGLWGIAQQNTF